MVSLIAPAKGQSPGFRVETDLFVEGTREPIQQSLTLFSEGVAYDTSRDDDGETTMVDASRDRIVLLNDQHQLQTTVKISDLTALMNSARQQALTTGLAVYLRGASQVQADEERVIVGDSVLRYEASLQRPSDLNAATAYAKNFREFADAVKQLNSLRSFGDPPFARLALNAAIADQHALPQKITLTANKGDQSTTYNCMLHATWRLSKSDLGRIAKIGEKLATYEDVDSTEYQKRTTVERVATSSSAGQPQ